MSGGGSRAVLPPVSTSVAHSSPSVREGGGERE